MAAFPTRSPSSDHRLASLACLLLSPVLAQLSVSVDPTIALSAPIRPNFVGISVEWGDVNNFIGKHPGPPKASYAQLLGNIMDKSAGVNSTSLRRGVGNIPDTTFRLRVGGGSTDDCWYNPTGLPAPNPSLGCFLNSSDFLSLLDFADMYVPPGQKPIVNISLTLGLNYNLESNDSLAIAEAIEIATLGHERKGNFVDAYEIGNEVDEYALDGHRWSGDWAPPLYWDTWTSYAKNITAATLATLRSNSSVPFQAATYCMTNVTWDEALASVLRGGNATELNISSVSYHRYGGSAWCSQIPITMDWFLSSNSTQILHRSVGDVFTAALDAGLPMYIGESNSIACGGQPNISDVFASALWAVSWLSNGAALNLTGFNIHSGSDTTGYTPFSFANPNSTLPRVNPIYYGLLAFAEFAANYSHLMSATATTGASPLYETWAVIDENNIRRVFVSHRGYNDTDPLPVTITFANTGPSPLPTMAYLARLWAPAGGVLARNAVTWAGQTFDDSTDGLPRGVRLLEPVPLVNSDSYTFNVYPGSAAMLIA